MRVLQDEQGVSLGFEESKGLYTLTMSRGPNVVNPEYVQLMTKALRIVERASHPKALIITGGNGKFFSNGLDLNFLSSSSASQKAALIVSFWRFLASLLVMDCTTIASINGHAFGAGLFLALACDYRLMRTQRGYLCWPEVNLGMRLAKGFSELSKAKVTDPRVLREGVLTAKRYDSSSALKAGLIDAQVPLEDLQDTSKTWALQKLAQQTNFSNFHPKSFQKIKIELYVDAYRALTSDRFDAPPESRL